MNISVYPFVFNGLIAFLISYKIFLIYRVQAEGSLKRMYRDFSSAFFLIALYFLFAVALQFSDSLSITQVLIHPFVALGTMFFCFAAFDPSLRNRLFIALAVLVVLGITSFMAFESLQPVTRHYFGSFYFVRSSRLPLLRLIDAALVIGFLLPSAIAVFMKSLKAPDFITRFRLLLISIGLFSLLLASVLAFTLSSSSSTWSNFLASIIAIPAFFTVLFALLYHREVHSESV